MGKYIRCPRCELNWITEDLDLCEVCKAELKGELLIDDEEDILCPRCKQNYLEPGETICASCLSGNSIVEGAVCAPDTDVDTIIDGETTVSLAEMQETELDEDAEDVYDDDDGFGNEEYSDVDSEIEEEEEVIEIVKVDDDDDFEYVNPDEIDDFEDDEDEDEEDEEDEE